MPDFLKEPIKAINATELVNNSADALLKVVDELVENDAIVEWHELDLAELPVGRVLAAVAWSKLGHIKPDGSPAVFYEPYLGEYFECDNGEIRFLLDHGDGALDEPGEEGTDWINPPPFWTRMITPDLAGVDV